MRYVWCYFHQWQKLLLHPMTSLAPLTSNNLPKERNNSYKRREEKVEVFLNHEVKSKSNGWWHNLPDGLTVRNSLIEPTFIIFLTGNKWGFITFLAISMIFVKSENPLGFHLFCFNTVCWLLVWVCCVLLLGKKCWVTQVLQSLYCRT